MYLFLTLLFQQLCSFVTQPWSKGHFHLHVPIYIILLVTIITFTAI
jgi:hypothetical protein